MMLACDSAPRSFNPSKHIFNPYFNGDRLPISPRYPAHLSPAHDGDAPVDHAHLDPAMKSPSPPPTTTPTTSPHAPGGSAHTAEVPSQAQDVPPASAAQVLPHTPSVQPTMTSSMPTPSLWQPSHMTSSPAATGPTHSEPIKATPSEPRDSRYLENEMLLYQRLQYQQQQLMQMHQQRYDFDERGPQTKLPAPQSERYDGRRQECDSDSSGHSDASDRFRDSVPDDQKDEKYWERRRRNNEAARKTRDKRKTEDTVVETRISTLEDDNSQLRRELLALKKKFKIPDPNEVKPKPTEKPQEKEKSFSDRPNPSQYLKEMYSQSVKLFNPANSSPGTPISVPSMLYHTPPPLQRIPGGLPMGMGLYPDSSALPYMLSEASRVNEERRNSLLSSGLPHFRHSFDIEANHQQQRDLQQQYFQQNIKTSTSQALDMIKHEPMEEGEVRSRDRSGSIIETPPIDRPDMALRRTGPIGSFPPYRQPSLISPPSMSNHQVTHHHHHHHSAPVFPGPSTNHPASSNANRFLPGRYDPYSHQAPQRSPASSNSSDDNYDEPLQLTVRRDSSNTNHNSSHTHDDSSHDSDQGEKSPPVSPNSAFPLKLRHKLPLNDLPPHDFSYPKDSFSSMAAAAAVSAVSGTQPAFPFMSGLAHLSDMAMGQPSPLSVLRSEEHQNNSLYARHRSSNASSRRSSIRNPGKEPKYTDPKYLERRRRNNEAARKCRENRKALTKLREAKSDYLEDENSKLRDELNSLQEEMKQLRDLIEKKRHEQGLDGEANAES